MNVNFRIIHLHKRFPLTISRGTQAGSDNLFISLTKDGITGWGELSPGRSEGADTPERARRALEDFCHPGFEALSVCQLYDRGREQGVPACAMAGLDMALWDWLGKKANLPLYRLLGLGKPTVPTSVTIGINPPEVVKRRIPLLLRETGTRCLKIKLGSPEGIEADQDMYAQVVESTRSHPVALRVDANGGWTADEAIFMMKWLAGRGADYVEQPLGEGEESELPRIFKGRPLPVYVDESCRNSGNIPGWADCVDGVNLKLMKCGGITEALRIIAVARAHNLKTMIGCMGESSMSISAGAAISGLLDHVDLDSHLNLSPDPCTGARLVDGIVMPSELPGHGARIIGD